MAYNNLIDKEVRIVLDRVDSSQSFGRSQTLTPRPLRLSLKRRNSSGTQKRCNDLKDSYSQMPERTRPVRKRSFSSLRMSQRIQSLSQLRRRRSRRIVKSQPELNKSLTEAVMISDSDDEFEKTKIVESSPEEKRHKHKLRKRRSKRESEIRNQPTRSIKEKQKEKSQMSQLRTIITQEYLENMEVINLIDEEEDEEERKNASPSKLLEPFLKFNKRESNGEILPNQGDNDLMPPVQIKVECKEESSENENGFYLNINGERLSLDEELPKVDEEDDDVEKKLIAVAQKLDKNENCTTTPEKKSVNSAEDRQQRIAKCSKKLLFDDSANENCSKTKTKKRKMTNVKMKVESAAKKLKMNEKSNEKNGNEAIDLNDSLETHVDRSFDIFSQSLPIIDDTVENSSKTVTSEVSTDVTNRSLPKVIENKKVEISTDYFYKQLMQKTNWKSQKPTITKAREKPSNVITVKIPIPKPKSPIRMDKSNQADNLKSLEKVKVSDPIEDELKKLMDDDEDLFAGNIEHKMLTKDKEDALNNSSSLSDILNITENDHTLESFFTNELFDKTIVNSTPVKKARFQEQNCDHDLPVRTLTIDNLKLFDESCKDLTSPLSSEENLIIENKSVSDAFYEKDTIKQTDDELPMQEMQFKNFNNNNKVVNDYVPLPLLDEERESKNGADASTVKLSPRIGGLLNRKSHARSFFGVVEELTDILNENKVEEMKKQEVATELLEEEEESKTRQSDLQSSSSSISSTNSDSSDSSNSEVSAKMKTDCVDELWRKNEEQLDGNLVKELKDKEDEEQQKIELDENEKFVGDLEEKTNNKDDEEQGSMEKDEDEQSVGDLEEESRDREDEEQRRMKKDEDKQSVANLEETFKDKDDEEQKRMEKYKNKQSLEDLEEELEDKGDEEQKRMEPEEEQRNEQQKTDEQLNLDLMGTSKEPEKAQDSDEDDHISLFAENLDFDEDLLKSPEPKVPKLQPKFQQKKPDIEAAKKSPVIALKRKHAPITFDSSDLISKPPPKIIGSMQQKRQQRQKQQQTLFPQMNNFNSAQQVTNVLPVQPNNAQIKILPNQQHPPAATDFTEDLTFMEKDFNEVFGYTDLSNNDQKDLFSSPKNVRQNHIANGQTEVPIMFQSTAPPQFKVPIFGNEFVSLSTVINNLKNQNELPESFSPSNILKPISDVKKRLGVSRTDKGNIFANFCFGYLSNGVCPRKAKCRFNHKLVESFQNEMSREMTFTIVHNAKKEKFFFFIKSIYRTFLSSLDYEDACELLKLVCLEPNIVTTRGDVKAVLEIMLKKPKTSLSNLVIDLCACTSDPALQLMIFTEIQSRVNVGQFWNTFRLFFQNNFPRKSCLDLIIEECVKLKKNRDHLEDVCKFLYYLKYDCNLMVDISGIYYDSFIDLIKKENLHEYLKIFGIEMIPPVPKSVVAVPKVVTKPDIQTEKETNIAAEVATDKIINNDDNASFTSENIDVETILKEAELSEEENYQSMIKDSVKVKLKLAKDQHVESTSPDEEQDNNYKLVKAVIPDERSRYHDSFAELNADIFKLEFNLRQHNYVNVVNILKKYSVDEDKSPYQSACFHKCYRTIKKFGESIVNKGKEFQHAHEFWLFIKDLRDFKHWLTTHVKPDDKNVKSKIDNAWRAVKLFQRYAKSTNAPKQKMFSHICYLILREEFKMTENYFMLVQQVAVYSRPQDTLLNFLVDLGSRILLAFADKGHWFYAYKLIKYLKNCPCSATFALLQAQIFVANQRSYKAYKLLKRTMIIFKDRKRWTVPNTSEDESLRIDVINVMMEALTYEDVEIAFILFELLLIDQCNINHPIDLTRHVNHLLIQLILQKKSDILEDLSFIIMKYNILLADPIFRLAVIQLTRQDVTLGEKFFYYAANCGIYNILKHKKVNLLNEIIIRLDATEEELYLIVLDAMKQLQLNYGSAIIRLKNRMCKVYLNFQNIPNAKRLYCDKVANVREVLLRSSFDDVKVRLENVLTTKFYPPLKLLRDHTRERYFKLQQKSLLKYLKTQKAILN